MRKQVFLSYRHESQEHVAAVHRLGKLLCDANIPVALDRFYLDEHPGGPDEGGWPKWSEQAANESQCVLIMASEGWFAAYEGTGEPGAGMGAATEADLFRQSLWDEKGRNARIRLAFLHPIAHEKVPIRLRAWHQFHPFDNPEDFSGLVRWLASSLDLEGVEIPQHLWPEPGNFEPEIADRNKKEWPAIVDMLSGRVRERILLIEGPSGVGKSELLRQGKSYARQLTIPVAYVDFRGGMRGLPDVLEQIALDVGEHLPTFASEGATKTYLLRKDLRSLRRPILLIFDTYEGTAENKAVTDWLNQQLLPETETALALAVIIAGQRTPAVANATWRDLATHLLLENINDLAAWRRWASRRYPDVPDQHLEVLVNATKGSPNLMAALCRNLTRAE
jgi:hypothetical protein